MTARPDHPSKSPIPRRRGEVRLSSKTGFEGKGLGPPSTRGFMAQNIAYLMTSLNPRKSSILSIQQLRRIPTCGRLE